MVGDDHPWVRFAWLTTAALAGAITSLSLTQWKTMDRREIILSIIVGFSFAVFVAPVIGTMVFHVDESDLRIMGAVMYFGATGANAFIPMLIKRFTRPNQGVE